MANRKLRIDYDAWHAEAARRRWHNDQWRIVKVNIERAPQSGVLCGAHKPWQRSTFAEPVVPTIIDAPMFHFRVRDGTGWDHWAVTTRLRSAVGFEGVFSQAVCPMVAGCVFAWFEVQVMFAVCMSLRVGIREVAGFAWGRSCCFLVGVGFACVESFTPGGVEVCVRWCSSFGC